MDKMKISKDIIELLQYLLPGFLCAWVFYGLTSWKKPSELERIVQALIFTLLTRAVLFAESALLLWIGDHLVRVGQWTTNVELVNVTMIAIVFGIVLAYFTNNDGFHGLARRLNITRETSFPSNWFSAFRNRITYVVLHMKDERRLYGWLSEWPSDPDEGHFLVLDPSWLDEDKEIPIAGVDCIAIDVKDVRWIEFMKKTWENDNGKQGRESTSTANGHPRGLESANAAAPSSTAPPASTTCASPVGIIQQLENK